MKDCDTLTGCKLLLGSQRCARSPVNSNDVNMSYSVKAFLGPQPRSNAPTCNRIGIYCAAFILCLFNLLLCQEKTSYFYWYLFSKKIGWLYRSLVSYIRIVSMQTHYCTIFKKNFTANRGATNFSGTETRLWVSKHTVSIGHICLCEIIMKHIITRHVSS